MSAMGLPGPDDAMGEPVDPATARTARDHRPAAKRLPVVDACVAETEVLFFSETLHCAEAVVSVIRKHFRPETAETVVRLVSGLGNGCGVGCICGAISGATVAIGMALQDRETVERTTRTLHEWFKETYGTACCKALQHKHGEGCRVNPGAVAGKLAELLLALGEEPGS